MVNYQNGKIYKITGTTANGVELIYIGSTTTSLCQRFAGHKDTFKKNTGISSHQVMECLNCKIILIELYPCSCIEELLMRERYYFDIYDCININKPILFKEDIVERHKQNYIKNAEHCKIRSKEYYNNHRVESKEYYKKNIEEYKKYYNENKIILNQNHKEYNNINEVEIKKYQKKYREWKKISNIYLNILLND